MDSFHKGEIGTLNRITSFTIVLLAMLGSMPLSHADLSKTEEREINAYRLTKSKIAQFSQATKNLLAAYEKDPKMFERPAVKTSNSLADMVQATNDIPAAKKAIEEAGMTAKEYWTFQLALLYAGTGNMVLKSGGQLPEGYSKENVEFYRLNEAEFMKLDADLKALQRLSSKSSDETEEETVEDDEQPEEDEE
jgi:hypothetical protein